MIFYFLISIVFIAEIIITIALAVSILKLDKIFVEYNSIISDAKPMLKDILETCNQISEKCLELAPTIVNTVKNMFNNIIIGHVKSIIGALTFWLVKKEVEKHI